jgi:hypothetical protein
MLGMMKSKFKESQILAILGEGDARLPALLRKSTG